MRRRGGTGAATAGPPGRWAGLASNQNLSRNWNKCNMDVLPRPADVQKRHNNNFNLCRLILASLVIFSHVPEVIDGNRSRELLTRMFHTVSLGEVAVDGFFVLSGYLIVQSWLSSPKIGDYLQKRLLRIFPGFIVASLICALLVGPLAGAADYLAQFGGRKFVAGMMTLGAPQVPPVFAGTHYPVVNGAMWTIHFEFWCYLAVLGFGVLGLLSDRRIWLWATVLIVVMNIAHTLGYHPALPIFQDPLAHPFVRLSMPFFCGACFFLYRDRVLYTRTLLLIAMMVLVAGLFSPVTAEPALAIMGGYGLFYFAKTHLPVLAAFNRLPDISYGVYLYGWPSMKLILWFYQDISIALLIVTTLATSLLLGMASWHLVEKPCLKLKNRKFVFPFKKSHQA